LDIQASILYDERLRAIAKFGYSNDWSQLKTAAKDQLDSVGIRLQPRKSQQDKNKETTN
jgi:hypothetical protein